MNILEYFGNFHPLVIHLPIGILTAFLFLTFFISRDKLLESVTIVKVILALSAFSALFSSFSGLILSNSGSYDIRLISFHQWLGILLTILNIALYYKIEFLLKGSLFLYRMSNIVMLVLLILTGHAGGSLTHGSDFINPPAPKQWFSQDTKEEKIIGLNSTAYEAASLIFEKKCFVCHGNSKQKGELRLDSKTGILKGSENGPVISETAMESTLIKSLLLPLDHKDHMPPKEKTQLTDTEIKFLTWWIDKGADFESSLTELQFPDSLHDLLHKEELKVTDSAIPLEEVKAADIKLLEVLRELDAIVIPLGNNSNFLSVNFVNVLERNNKEVFDKLIAIRPQIVWLDISYRQLEEDSWKALGELSNLRKLDLRYSNLDDSKLSEINKLDGLVHLNLVGTKITASGIQKIKSLQNLETLYLYQTDIRDSNADHIQEVFPNTRINFGNYNVPILKSDTTVFTLELRDQM